MSNIIELDPKAIHSVVIDDKFILIHIENENENDKTTTSEIEILINDKKDESSPLILRNGIKFIEKNLKVKGELKVINNGPVTINLEISFL